MAASHARSARVSGPATEARIYAELHWWLAQYKRGFLPASVFGRSLLTGVRLLPTRMKVMTSVVSCCCLWLAMMTARTDAALIPGDSDQMRRLLNAIFEGGSIPPDMYTLANEDTHQDPPPSSQFNIPDTEVSPTHPDPREYCTTRW